MSKTSTLLFSVASLLLYGYLLFFANISAESLKYTVIAGSFGILYPLVSLEDNEFLIGNKIKCWGVFFVGLCIVLLFGYFMREETEKGLLWDFFMAISTKWWLIFYLVILVIAIIFALTSKTISLWVSSFAIGVIFPVFLSAIIALLLLWLGLSILGSVVGSKSSPSFSSSLSSILGGSTSETTNSKESVEKNNLVRDDIRYYTFEIEYTTGGPLTYTCDRRLPHDVTLSDITKIIKKDYGTPAKVINYKKKW